MSLNVENLFIKCDDAVRVADVVENHWRSSSTLAQPNWGLPSSFESLLAREPKRKLAISPAREGWVALVESKEVVDFGLAKALAEKLGTTVLAIQISEVSGTAGWALAVRGQLLQSELTEDHRDPLNLVRAVLKKHKVPYEPILFREAVQKLTQGWTLNQKK